MKSTIRRIVVLVSLSCMFCAAGVAQRKKTTPKCDSGAAKVKITCPTTLNGIGDCPDTGCGTVDPLMNKQKNIAVGDPDTAKDKDFSYLAGLPNRVKGYEKIGDSRAKLAKKGEGKMIRIVAYALDARKGSKESCNCGLGAADDTDNHIVLVDKPTLALTAKATPAQKPSPKHPKGVKARSAAYNTLKLREAQSETAEFTPRVRLDHPGLVGADLKNLIMKAPKQALLVRVTGLQFYDSEHALGCNKLLRHNDWEIHPVFKLEYCPNGKTCTKNSDQGWVSMEP